MGGESFGRWCVSEQVDLGDRLGRDLCFWKVSDVVPYTGLNILWKGLLCGCPDYFNFWNRSLHSSRTNHLIQQLPTSLFPPWDTHTHTHTHTHTPCSSLSHTHTHTHTPCSSLSFLPGIHTHTHTLFLSFFPLPPCFFFLLKEFKTHPRHHVILPLNTLVCIFHW